MYLINMLPGNSPLLGYATMEGAVFHACGDITTGDSNHVTCLLLADVSPSAT
jgi:hypothetical protein